MAQQFKNRRNNTVTAHVVPQDERLKSSSKTSAKLWLGSAIVLVTLVAFRGNPAEPPAAEARAEQPSMAVVKPAQKPFPSVNASAFTSAQLNMLELLQSEYAKQPVSYDSDVMRYTEGFKESWCADFISWIRNEAGVPYEHQETGYWRIPGVQTLRDYYMGSDAYHVAGDYTPKFGDVAFYFGETPDGNSREHVALVLSVQGGMITTIGGNETSKGILQIRTNKLAEGERGLTGFGVSRL